MPEQTRASVLKLGYFAELMFISHCLAAKAGPAFLGVDLEVMRQGLGLPLRQCSDCSCPAVSSPHTGGHCFDPADSGVVQELEMFDGLSLWMVDRFSGFLVCVPKENKCSQWF